MPLDQQALGKGLFLIKGEALSIYPRASLKNSKFKKDYRTAENNSNG